MNFHLSHLPEVQAAIAAAAACDTIDELRAAVTEFDAHPVAASSEAVTGRPGGLLHAPYEGCVMILGKSPAATEVATGMPFQGPAGQMLRQAFEGVGLDIEGAWLTTACYWPVRDSLPKATHLAISRPFLLREIRLVRPSVILALGEKAVEGLFQEKATVSDKFGTVRDLDVDGRAIPVHILMNHAYVMYNPPERLEPFRQHVLAAARAHPDAFAALAAESRLAA